MPYLRVEVVVAVDDSPDQREEITRAVMTAAAGHDCETSPEESCRVEWLATTWSLDLPDVLA